MRADVAESIGRELLVYGRRVPKAEMFARIDAVDASTVRAVADRFIYDQVSQGVPAWGSGMIGNGKGHEGGVSGGSGEWTVARGATAAFCVYRLAWSLLRGDLPVGLRRTWPSRPSATSSGCPTTAGGAGARTGCAIRRLADPQQVAS